MGGNRNKNLKWALDHNFAIEDKILNSEIRGVYGFFVGDECVYVGRSYSIYARLFKGPNCHIKKIIVGEHVPKILAAMAEGQKVDRHIVGAEVVDLRMRLESEMILRVEHNHALRLAGGTTGVEDIGHVAKLGLVHTALHLTFMGAVALAARLMPLARAVARWPSAWAVGKGNVDG